MKNNYDLREIFQQIELELIKSMKRALYHHENEEQKEGFKWEQWQIAKLRGIEKFRRNNQKILDKYSNSIENTIKNTLNESFNGGQNRVTKIINRIREMFHRNKSEASFNFPESAEPKTPVQKILSRISQNVPQENAFFGVNEKKLNALITATTNDLKAGQFAMLRMAYDVYRQTIFKSHMFLQSGTKTLYQAIDMATKDFLDKGFNCIQYKNGNRVNIASYVEMALRTANQRATFMGEGQKRNEWGIHLVVVSAHANTCKLCLPWQGKILIDDVYSNGSKADGGYPLLSEAMKAGLLHPNCRHTLATYFEGITQLPTVPDEDLINQNYAAEQKQRYMERQIRIWKRIEEGSCDAENVNKADDKVKEWQDKLSQHLKDNSQLRRDYERENNKIPVEKSGKNDILSDRKWLKSQFPTQKKFDTHIKKHLGEYGDITQKEYLNMARELLAAPLSDDVEGFVSKDGFLFKYRKSTNDFALGRADGKISTIFKPKDAYDYWLQQIKDYKEA